MAYVAKTIPDAFLSRPILDLEVFAILTSLNSLQRSVTRQLRWRTEASGWAASAACPHYPTACVGHSRGHTAILTYTWTIRKTTARALYVRAWTNQQRMTDEHQNFGTSKQGR